MDFRLLRLDLHRNRPEEHFSEQIDVAGLANLAGTLLRGLFLFC